MSTLANPAATPATDPATTTARGAATSEAPGDRGATRRPLAVLGGLALGLAPLLLVGGNVTVPPQDSGSNADYVEALARDPFLTHLSAALYHYGWVLFGFGLLAAIGLVRGRRGRALALVGGVGGAFGAVQMSGMLLADWFNGAAGRTVPVADAARILDTVSASPSLQVWLQTAQVGSLLLPLFLFLGLARAGVISFWIAPLSVLGFIGGPVVSGLVGGETLGLVVSTVASLAFNVPVFVTAARLVTRGRTDTVTA